MDPGDRVRWGGACEVAVIVPCQVFQVAERERENCYGSLFG